MNYHKAQSELKAKYPPTAAYFHNYLFPHAEKRTYRNKLTFVDDNVQYLGVTLKDKTDRHWLHRLGKPILSKKENRGLIDSSVKVVTQSEAFPLIGNNAPDGYKHFYDHNGLVLSFKRPKLRSYFSNILNCDGDVKYLGLRKIEVKSLTKPSTSKRISKYELYRRQFDLLPKSDKYCCYCEIELDRLSVTRDHIIPVSRGGLGSNYGHPNIKPCCVSCNGEKGNLMLHSYIQLLNYKLEDVVKGSQDYLKLQTKIRNANNIAITLPKHLNG